MSDRIIKAIEYRKARPSEWNASMDLAFCTFMRFEAPVYTQEGVENFHEFVRDDTLEKMFLNGEYKLYVALDDDVIVGMISLRDGSHISLLFVDADYHGMGVGRGLMEVLCRHLIEETDVEVITVNSSPYAVGFYHKLGFYDTDETQVTDGITYTPMERKIR